MDFKERLLNEIKALKVDSFTDRLLNKKLGIYSTFEKREVTKALDSMVKDEWQPEDYKLPTAFSCRSKREAMR